MTHKEKCKQLKAMRKEMADKVGVDLNQTECTYAGECSGTCAKCRQEEKKLNKALLASGIALTGLMLTACQGGSDDGSRERVRTRTSTEVVEPLAGETVYIPPEEGDDACSTDTVIDTVELSGDVTMEAYSEKDMIKAAKNYCPGASIYEIDHYEDDGDVAVVHCYDLVDDGDGEGHTATYDFLFVDIWSGRFTNTLGEEYYLRDYL